MARIRLDKFLADAGQGSRSQVKNYIRGGQVTVNHAVENSPERKVDTERDTVCLSGRAVSHEAFSYYMLNKPGGVVSATRDAAERTVLSLITEDKRRDLFPVGRLDKDTEGLLLITNDGKLSRELLAPKRHVEKTYFARVEGEVTDREVELFLEGVDIGDERLTAPARLSVLKAGTVSEVEIAITEGRYHQIKRMFHAVGMEVLYLKRLAMGGLRLDETLPLGAYRRLTQAELSRLKSETGGDES